MKINEKLTSIAGRKGNKRCAIVNESMQFGQNINFWYGRYKTLGQRKKTQNLVRRVGTKHSANKTQNVGTEG